MAPINIKPLLTELAAGRPLNGDQMREVFDAILAADATPAQIGAFLMGLECSKIDAAETLIAGASAMRAQMIRLEVPFETMDVCGTGGDGAHSLNISTTTSFVLAGGGHKVAKHGNRSMSSICGAADVLEAMGIKLTSNPKIQTKALEDANLAFFFAPNYHPKMAYVGPLRRELGFGTAFNIMGPLCNPVGAQRQLIGVYRPELLHAVAQALAKLGSKSCWVIHGDGGIDEAILHGETQIVAYNGKDFKEFSISPQIAGLKDAPLQDLKGGDASFNANALMNLLKGEKSPYRDAVLLNASCALVMAGLADDLRQGVEIGEAIIDTGCAMNSYETLKSITNEAI
ncbi:MAG: anthranilate phosphoribosyltransferase [Caulobacterales bacterium]|nr:anthranilate phosphoribosyltransferase [Caulobacterales bacterium]MCA0372946.1 anthranilate phosphoribosyltransferase [Pseudomonadota bacterium]